MRISINLILQLGILLNLCNVAFAQTIEFDSLNSQDGFRAIYSSTAKYTDRINGVYTRPSGVVGNVPVIVIMHGSAGTSPAGTGAWSEYFLKLGVATFVVDSFNPRGFKASAADQSVLTEAGSAADALTALKSVSAIPGVDVNRIGIIGFSRGGNAALQSGFTKIKTSVLGENSTLKYALHIGFYSGCVRTGTTDGTPYLILTGDRDDYHSLKSCVVFADTLKRKGANLTFVVYPGATHGFDQERKGAYAAKAQTWGTCTNERVEDLDTLDTYIDGRKVTAKDYREYSKSCMTTGVMVEPNRFAINDSKKRVEGFVRQYFGI